jgi:glutathione S-transferase
MNQNPEEDKIFAAKIEKYLNELSDQIKGPFYFGDEISLVEIDIAPFLYRFHIIMKHYRDYNIFGE